MNGIGDFDLVDRELILEIARETVSSVAPEELPLFTIVTKIYFDTNGRIPSERATRDEMLGFGLESAVVLLTPVILPVVAAILDQLAQDVARVATERGKDGLRRAIRALLRRDAGEGGEGGDGGEGGGPLVAPLTPEQLARVRLAAFEKARQMDLPGDKAALLADAVTGSLGAAG
ncbi:hypothetical protein [Nonomuraea zeae]|uniref:Uncharacterized protein n=1 Tax=Nonomuraea zeae TaxID=1642303 RepID=A0A5S4GMW4_9ACTN|nr:hypothetical protein [Nonomuraea zeae]TMR34213.1 hypothetical protein ETD85_17370 [Nonomuraea zeae]